MTVPVITLDGLGLPSDQIHQRLRTVIQSGALAAGERLPPVRQLARDLGVAAGTVAKAYKLLEREGLVVSRAGGGTRVNSAVPTPPAQVLQAARTLSELAAGHGLGLEETISAVRASWIGS
ncbi:GntR family transcriptional regulator [Cryobacterium sp. HLT2-28]|nr:GntR family transcriptional regulator [Cryobacterium sp. HLT2-28]